MLVSKLESSDLGVRYAALIDLKNLTPEALTPHAGAISRLLDDDDGQVRKAAVDALGRLAPDVLASHAETIARRLVDD